MPETEPINAAPRILLVEDNADGRNALQKLLSFQGFEVTDVALGTSALEHLAHDPVPDAVLVDLLLPDMDGRDVARAASELSPRPFIALITGWSAEESQSDLSSWGIDHVFFKPLDVVELVGRLRQGGAGAAGA